MKEIVVCSCFFYLDPLQNDAIMTSRCIYFIFCWGRELKLIDESVLPVTEKEGKGDMEHRPKDKKWIRKPMFILRLNKWSGLCINISYAWCNKQWMHCRYWIDTGKKYDTSDYIKAWYKGSASLWYTGKGFFKRVNMAVTCIVWNSAEINWKKINLFRHQRIQQ